MAGAGVATIREIFEHHGEPAFRDLEHVAMEGLLDGPPSVIASGGGWAAQEGNLTAAEPRALSIYLSLPAEVAARRLRGVDDRPLLGREPLERMRDLLAKRERWYRLAGIEIAAEAAPELVAEAVATAARQYAGW